MKLGRMKLWRSATTLGLLAVSLMSLVSVIPAAAAEMLDPALGEQVLSIPGDPADPVPLQVTLFVPKGSGPFPLAVVNHGKDQRPPRDEPRYRSAYAARYFLSRGYAVALPMLRGFAGSGGTFDPHGCDAAADGLAQARDIAAVISSVARLPAIDSSRIIVSGQSFGGWNTLALGTMDIPGVRGLLNFAGGARQPNCGGWAMNLINGAGEYGGRTRVPSLWFYGDNDTVFSATIWRGMHRSYTLSGGRAELVAFGSFMSDAHQMLSYPEGFPIWMPKVDAFLSGLGLPGAEIEASYLPAQSPPPSHFASIDDVNAVPFLTAKTRPTYQQFLSRRFPRVFLVTSSGTTVAFDGGYDPLTRARAACRQHALACQLYAVDDQVVWRSR